MYEMISHHWWSLTQTRRSKWWVCIM